MKKLIVAIALSLFSASSVFAATTITIDFNNAGKTLHGDKTTSSATTARIGKLSTGVALGAFVNATGTGYSILTQHKNGTKLFGSSYDSTSVYTATISSTNVGVAGGGVLSVPTAITSTDFMGTAWTSM